MKGHSAAAAAPSHCGHNDAVHHPTRLRARSPTSNFRSAKKKSQLWTSIHGSTARSPAPRIAASHQLQIARMQPRATPHPAASHQAESSHTRSSHSAPQIQIARVTTSLIRAGAQRTPQHPRGRSCTGPLLAQPLLAEPQRRDHLAPAAPPPSGPRRRLQDPKPEHHEPQLQLLAELRHSAATTPAIRHHTGRNPCAARLTPHLRAKGARRGALTPPAALGGRAPPPLPASAAAAAREARGKGLAGLGFWPPEPPARATREEEGEREGEVKD